MFLTSIMNNALVRCFKRDCLGEPTMYHFSIVANRLLAREDIDIESQPCTEHNVRKVLEYVEDYADELYSYKED